METITIKEATKEKLMELVKKANGKRRVRILGGESVDRFMQLVSENPDKSVQVRAEAVSNSYGNRADSTYLRYNYVTKNVQVGAKTFKVAYGDNGSEDVKKYNYGF